MDKKSIQKKWKRKSRYLKIKKFFEPIVEYQVVFQFILGIGFWIFVFTSKKEDLFHWAILFIGGYIALLVALYLIIGVYKVRSIFLLVVSSSIAYILFELDRRGIYVISNNKDNILSELFGLLFDIILFGLVIVYYDKIIEKRNTISNYLDDIDDLKDWNSEEAKYRIVGRLKRLIKYEKSPADIGGLDLSKMNLSGVYLVKTNLEKCKFLGSCLNNAKLTKSNSKSTNFQNVEGENVELSNSKLDDSNFQNSKFKLSWFCESDFTGANCKNSTFEECNFTSIFGRFADFSNSDLRKSDFSLCYLRSANFANADLRQCKFENSTLNSANFANADLRHSAFRNIKIEIFAPAELEFCINLENAKVDNPNWIYNFTEKFSKELREAINKRFTVDRDERIGDIGFFYLIQKNEDTPSV